MADLDIAAFLRARFDEREKGLRALADKRSVSDLPTEIDMLVNTQVGVLMTSKRWPFGMPPYEADAWRELLADVKAKRQILDEHRYPEGLPQMSCPRCASWDEDDRTYSFSTNPCLTLRLLALPYAGHPDFREEWRP